MMPLFWKATVCLAWSSSVFSCDVMLVSVLKKDNFLKRGQEWYSLGDRRSCLYLQSNSRFQLASYEYTVTLFTIHHLHKSMFLSISIPSVLCYCYRQGLTPQLRGEQSISIIQSYPHAHAPPATAPSTPSPPSQPPIPPSPPNQPLQWP